MEAVDEKVLDKIKKLMRLAQSPNENEAALALQRAQELMAQYDISEAKLSISDSSHISEPIKEEKVERNGKRMQWRGTLASGCAKLAGCKMYWGNGGTDICIVGKATKIQAATYMFQWVAREVDRMANRGWDEIWADAKESQISWKNSFKLGMAERLHMRMVEMVSDRARLDVAVAKVDPSVGQALVVIDKDRQALNDYIKGMGLGKGKAVAPPRYASAYRQGAEAGQKIDLETGGKRGLPEPKKRVGQ